MSYLDAKPVLLEIKSIIELAKQLQADLTQVKFCLTIERQRLNKAITEIAKAVNGKNQIEATELENLIHSLGSRISSLSGGVDVVILNGVEPGEKIRGTIAELYAHYEELSAYCVSVGDAAA